MKLLPAILAMAAIVVASNILVQIPLGGYLTWGALTYPFAFLVTDLTNRLQGPAAARRVVLAGFAVGLACSFVGTQIEGEFGRWSPCGWRWHRGWRSCARSFWTLRSSTGCGRGNGGKRPSCRRWRLRPWIRRSSFPSPSRPRWWRWSLRMTWPGRAVRCRFWGWGGGAAVAVARRGGLDGEDCHRLHRPCAVSHHSWASGGKGCVKSVDEHQICVTFPLSATH